MFVQHHLTLDSAEHRNSDSRSRRTFLWGNLFRACRSVKSELRGLRMDGGSEAEAWLCQMPNFTSNAFFSLIFRDDRHRFPSFFLLWPSCPFFNSYSFFLSFSLSLSVSALSAVERSFCSLVNRSPASTSANANASAPLILRERAKDGILARSQMFPREQEEQRELISSSSRV